MVFSVAWARPPRWAKAMGGVRSESTMEGLYGGRPGRIPSVEALWLLLIPVVLVGGYFLLRGFMRLSKAIVELKTAMDDLVKAGAELNAAQQRVADLTESVDEARRQ